MYEDTAPDKNCPHQFIGIAPIRQLAMRPEARTRFEIKAKRDEKKKLNYFPLPRNFSFFAPSQGFPQIPSFSAVSQSSTFSPLFTG